MHTSIERLPKAELHLHIEGTFEPELIFEIAARNKVSMSYGSVDELKKAYHFADLQSFLYVYYAGMNVLRQEQDFTDLANAYLKKAAEQGVVHVEMFFDPQAHTQRGIAFDTVIDGLWQAVSKSQANYGITSKLIMCFLRDCTAESAMETLQSATKYGERIVAVGLDSAEVNNPPSKFQKVFEKAKAEGFLTVAHAGEEGPPQYVWEALDLLKVSRIDHGVRSLEDERLVHRLVEQQLALTVCPLSNVKLRVFDNLKDHNIGRMLELGIRATVNSDDPAYFGGYVADNYKAIQSALNMSDAEIVQLAKNSILASFITASERDRYLAMIDKAAGDAAEAIVKPA